MTHSHFYTLQQHTLHYHPLKAGEAERNPTFSKKMQTHRHLFLVTTLVFILFVLNVSQWAVQTQFLPPAKYDGFWYPGPQTDSDSIIVEAFFDPLCPDSRDAWPPLKRALADYGSRVLLVVHLLPLPYHDNAYVTSRALHIANLLNTSSTFPLLERFFDLQEKFYNDQTLNISKISIVEEVVKFTTTAVGNSYYCAIEAGFNDRETDLKTRVSFTYSASRGVFGTPTLFVNGFVVADSGSALDYNGWRGILDPLVRPKGGKSTDPLHCTL